MFRKKKVFEMGNNKITLNVPPLVSSDVFCFQHENWTISKVAGGYVRLEFDDSIKESIIFIKEKHLTALLELLTALIYRREKNDAVQQTV